MTCWLITGWVSLRGWPKPQGSADSREGKWPGGRLGPRRERVPCCLHSAERSAVCCEGCLEEGASEGGCSLEEYIRKEVGDLWTPGTREVRPKSRR